MSHVKIYHNPRCSKSRQTLELIKQKGIEPEIIKYLDTPPEPQEIKSILTMLNISARDLMRKNETDFKNNNMSDENLTEDQLIELMHQYPKVIERPVVVNGNKAAVGRPPESVLEIL